MLKIQLIIYEVVIISQLIQEKTLNTLLEVSRKIGLATLAISVFSSFSFLITYSFLFGYYFGGDVNNSFSNFELIRTFIPFDLNTILFTYLLLGLSITLIMYLAQIFFNKGIFTKIAVLFLFIIFHGILTVFFTKDLTGENIFKFSVIWIFPLFSSISILFFVRGIKNTFKVVAGMLLGFLIYVIIVAINQYSTNEPFLEFILLLLIFIFGIGFTFLPFNKFFNILFILPFTLLIVILTTPLVKFSFYQSLSESLKVTSILLISLLISWGSSVFLNKFFKNKESLNEPNLHTNSFNRIILEVTGELLNPKTHKKAAVFLIIFLLGIYVLLPRLATHTAKVIREYTPDSELQFHSIEVLALDGPSKTIEGIVVAEKENILYISNKNWKLEQIKTEKYHIKK